MVFSQAWWATFAADGGLSGGRTGEDDGVGGDVKSSPLLMYDSGGLTLYPASSRTSSGAPSHASSETARRSRGRKSRASLRLGVHEEGDALAVRPVLVLGLADI